MIRELPLVWIACLVVVTLLVLGATCVARANGSEPRARGFRVEAGQIEVVARVDKVSAPGFPNTTMNPFRRMPVHRFTVGQGGKPFVLEMPGVEGLRRIDAFNMVYRLVDAPEPAILLQVGGFHLLTAGEQGALELRSMGAMEHLGPMLQWLDGDDGQPAPEFSRNLGLREPSDIDLRGGRWLLLNRTVVLDTTTLRHYLVEPWIGSSSGDLMAGLNASTRSAIALSPDRSQYVLLGQGRIDVSEDDTSPALLVVDITSGNSYGVEIPAVLRTGPIDELVTRQWIEEHFEWRRAGSALRLVPRR